MSERKQDTADESEKISDPGRIARLLKQLAKHYCPLTLQISGHKTVYTSCIVSVEKPYVLLDELMPPSSHDAMTPECKIHVIGKLDGIDIQFSTTLVRSKKQKKLLTYYVNLPEQLMYLQRRQSYRVRIPLSQQLRILIDNGSDTMIAGELRDLSHGGAGKFIPDDKVIINQGQFYECVVELPCQEWLYCSIEVRHVNKIDSRKAQIIGTRFVGLSREQKRLISSCITVLEQEEMRKRNMI